MSDRTASWRKNFQKAQVSAAQIQNDLNKWELLAGATGGSSGERVKLGAALRMKVQSLKLELDQLQRDLDSLSKSTSAEKEVTRKSITQFKDELSQARAEFQELERRSKGNASASAFSSRSSTTSSLKEDLAGTSFHRLDDEDSKSSSARGAELQPVSQRSTIEKQRQMMRDFDEPLSHLEGSVGNLQQVSNMIRGEIQSQNRLLDNTNQATDQLNSRLGRVRTMINRFSASASRTRWLTCSVLLLLFILIALFVYIVLP
eukprot:TRINITY_DN48572_c0_g1_i1.p1 TRINITY_DN48572_c0_g1~~TRINITY_DN48572_c0_g1_i1.p1  ORF type:complete len:276 (+),score=57.80 TRINITY_DN48572_c0_g1_i1:51-830(+)